MAYRQILNSISVNGVKGVFAGGYIYSANLEIGYTEGPSKFSISCMLPDNASSFVIPTPALNETLYTIKFGDTNFIGYLLSVEQEYNAGQKMLHCVFVDRSIILDQYQVGLQFRHAKEAGKIGNLLVVPTRANTGGPNSPTLCVDCETLEIKEPSNPPPDNSTCDTNDVVYSFSSLINLIQTIIQVSNPPNSSGENSYTGSVREVLNNWCSDLGYSFFVDSNNSLRFINLSSGLGITLPFLDPSLVRNFRQLNTLEGSYSSGSSIFELTPTKNYTIDNQQYHQLTLEYVGPAFGRDAELGAWAMADSSARDIIVGMTPRNGFFNNYFNITGPDRIVHLEISGPELLDLSEIIGDNTIPDAMAKGYSRWILCYYSDQLKNAYLEQEKSALEQYGHHYIVADGAEHIDSRHIDRPEETEGPEEIECKPNLRRTTDFSYYPDFGGNLRWYKNVGPMSTDEKVFTQFTEPMIIATNTEIVNLVIQKNPFGVSAFVNPTHPLVSLVGIASGPYRIDMGPGDRDPEDSWEGRPYIEPGNTNTGEEELKYVNTRSNDTPCALECENSYDPCAEFLTKCDINVYGVKQGILSRAGNKIGNVVMPSVAPFYGWVKKDINASVNIKGTLTIDGPSTSSSQNFYESRFTLIDTSSGAQNVSVAGSAGAQTKISFEIIGLAEGIVLKPEHGLSRISMSFGTEGIVTSIEYNTRPPVIPKQNVTLQNVTPRKLLF